MPKLTPAQVLEIKRRSAKGESRNDLAKEFGVAATTIRNIRNGKLWKSDFIREQIRAGMNGSKDDGPH